MAARVEKLHWEIEDLPAKEVDLIKKVRKAIFKVMMINPTPTQVSHT